MSFSPKSNGMGFLEYFLIIIIVILGVFLLVKLFGPAVSQFIAQALKNT